MSKDKHRDKPRAPTDSSGDLEGLSGLRQLLEKLKLAWDQKDWEQIASVDLEVKQEVARVSSLQMTGEEALAREQTFQLLDKIYDRLIEAGKVHREDLAQQLRQVNREKKAVSAYQKHQDQF